MTQWLRITVIDRADSISFGAEGHVAKMIAAACAQDKETVDAVLETVASLDPEEARRVRTGLARFDEFVVRGQPESLTSWLESNDPAGGHPIRLVDPRLREMTLMPLSLGIVVFNLPDKRIIEIENRYGSLLRKDRGRVRRDGRPVRQVYRYELPDDWSLLP
jgi:hypothetical protein